MTEALAVLAFSGASQFPSFSAVFGWKLGVLRQGAVWSIEALLAEALTANAQSTACTVVFALLVATVFASPAFITRARSRCRGVLVFLSSGSFDLHRRVGALIDGLLQFLLWSLFDGIWNITASMAEAKTSSFVFWTGWLIADFTFPPRLALAGAIDTDAVKIAVLFALFHVAANAIPSLLALATPSRIVAATMQTTIRALTDATVRPGPDGRTLTAQFGATSMHGEFVAIVRTGLILTSVAQKSRQTFTIGSQRLVVKLTGTMSTAA